MSRSAPHFYEFGAFRLSPKERLLLREGQAVPLPHKAVETLLVLLENSGHVVEKEELMRRLWPDTFVEENNLTHYISSLRKVLADGVDGRRFIETVPKRGYRFAVDVREVWAEDAGLVFTEQTSARVIITDEIEEIDENTSLNVTPTTITTATPSLIRRLPSSAAAVLIVLLGLIVIAGANYLFLDHRPGQSGPATSLPEVRSIAVLPFSPVGVKDDEDDYVGLGIADAVITKLAGIRRLNVRPTTAIQRYTDVTRDAAKIGRELKTDVVLDGRFQKSGDRIRVTAQLVNVRDGTLLWTGQFDERLVDLFAVQDSISEQATQALRLQLSAWERERLSRPTATNADAYQAYLKGRYFWNKRTLPDLNKGVENFRRAIELDPNYALAYAGLADCYNLLSEYNAASPVESFVAAEYAARKALELDESLAEAHTSLAYVLVNYKWEWAEGEREFKRAVELNPSYATAHQWYAEFLGFMGRPKEAQAELSRALELDPLSLIINAEQGLPPLNAGEYDRAIQKFRGAVELDPNFVVAHAYLSIAYEISGEDEQAFAEKLTTARLSGSSLEYLEGMRKAYACCGLRGLWRRDLNYQLARRRENYFSAYMIAQTYARIGDKARTFSWLSQAYKEHDRYIIGLNQDQAFVALRGDVRFQELLRDMNLRS